MYITVVIPVGPLLTHRKWLDECLDSVGKQTLCPTEVLLISDMSYIDLHTLQKNHNNCVLRKYNAPWHLGVAHAFNFGVALARNELVFMLGADDTLEPDCLEQCMFAFNKYENGLYTYFYTGVKYMDTQEEQFIMCNAAMVSKTLWRHTGGFPVEAFTAPDAALGSIFLRHGDKAGYMQCVNPTKTLYNYRRHPDTDTNTHRSWSEVITQTRNLVTLEWAPPKWERYV